MSRWEVRGNRDTVQVQAPNWMMAMGSAMEGLGLTGFELSCLVCDIQDDGVVRIYDPKQDTALLVRKLDDSAPADLGAPGTPAAVKAVGPAPDLGDAVPSAGELSSDEAAGLGDEDTEADEAATGDEPLDFAETLDEAEHPYDDAVPELDMPEPSLGPWGESPFRDEPSEAFDADDIAFVEAPSAGDTEAPEGLAEALFDATFGIAGAAEPRTAAESALEVLLQHVPAESAAVLFASVNDTGLRFLAVRGPSADDVRHIVVPFNRGIAGFAHERGADLIVHNAQNDPRHMGEVDEESGYRTRALLVASLRDEDGAVHGVVELLNPPDRFHPWHLDAARSVARTLADTLGRLT